MMTMTMTLTTTDNQGLVKGESVFPAPGAKRLPTATNCWFVIFTPLPCRHNLTIKDNQEWEESNFLVGLLRCLYPPPQALYEKFYYLRHNFESKWRLQILTFYINMKKAPLKYNKTNKTYNLYINMCIYVALAVRIHLITVVMLCGNLKTWETVSDVFPTPCLLQRPCWRQFITLPDCSLTFRLFTGQRHRGP